MVETVALLGAARSGTKFLRDALAQHPAIAAVPYDVNYVWRFGNEAHPDDELTPASVTPRAADFIRRTLPKMAEPKGRPVLLEKTVSNTLRVGFVHNVFPQARFIHLVRDGRAVTESAMRCWNDPPQMGSLLRKLRDLPLENVSYAAWFALNLLRGLASGRQGGKVWGPRYRGIDADVQNLSLLEVCARQWQRSVEASLSALAQLPAGSVYTVKYEDLVKDSTEISAILAFLGLPEDAATLETFRSRVESGGLNKWREALAAEDQAKLEGILGPTLKKLGYGS